MEQHAGVFISAIALAALFVGGFVKLRISIVKGFADLGARVGKIEVRLELDDVGKGDRDKLRNAEAHRIARVEIREHRIDCPGSEPTGVG